MTLGLFNRHKCWGYQTESVWSVPENTSPPCWGFKDSNRWWMAGFFWGFFLVSLMTTKTPRKLKMSPKSRFGEVMLCNRKDVERPPRVWPGLALIIWWGLWFQVITFMWRVRRTKWVFKGKSCQVLVFLIIGTLGRTDHTNTLGAVPFCWVEPLNFIESSVQWLLYWHHNYGPSL